MLIVFDFNFILMFFLYKCKIAFLFCNVANKTSINKIFIQNYILERLLLVKYQLTGV